LTDFSITVLEPAGAIPFSKIILGMAEVSPFKTCPNLPKKLVTKLGQLAVKRGANMIIWRYAREVHSEVVDTPQI
jgi:hypothetical protein